MQSVRRIGIRHLQLSSVSQRSATTHFGFENVPEEEKAKRVHTVFANVAHVYDKVNDLTSVGAHRLWKDHFVQIANPQPNSNIIDVAGGTGDIAFRLAQRIADKSAVKANISVYDINQMLDVGEYRAQTNYPLLSDNFKWICGDAESLPFADNSFDLYTIAFGIRNCTHVSKVLQEAYRVLKPGGKFACLEFSKVHQSLKPFYDLYSFNVIPLIGKVVASDYESYKYLVESIRMFPDQEEFSHMIKDAGFSSITYQNLTFGVCAIHTGIKP